MKRVLVALIICAIPIRASQAQAPKKDQRQNEMVDWLEPVRSSNKKQSPTEEETARRFGRDLPTREILQPALDGSLPAYHPREVRLSGKLKGACSDTLPALLRLWISSFANYYPDAKIEVSPPYDGNVAAGELVNGSVDFAVISRQLKPDDLTAFRVKFGYEPLSIPVSNGSFRHFGFLDAFAFFVHKNNPLDRISFDQLDAVLSSTHNRGSKPIETWGELGVNGELADKPIHIYGIKPWDGIEDIIRKRVLSVDGKQGEWRADIVFDGVFSSARRVAEDRYGFGFTGLAYIDAGVKVLALGESSAGPFFTPTYENVAQAGYPLMRLIFFNVNKSPNRPFNPLLAEFLRFILSRQGQQIVLEHAIFLPLRAEQITRSQLMLQ